MSFSYGPCLSAVDKVAVDLLTMGLLNLVVNLAGVDLIYPL